MLEDPTKPNAIFIPNVVFTTTMLQYDSTLTFNDIEYYKMYLVTSLNAKKSFIEHKISVKISNGHVLFLYEENEVRSS